MRPAFISLLCSVLFLNIFKFESAYLCSGLFSDGGRSSLFFLLFHWEHFAHILESWRPGTVNPLPWPHLFNCSISGEPPFWSFLLPRFSYLCWSDLLTLYASFLRATYALDPGSCEHRPYTLLSLKPCRCPPLLETHFLRAPDGFCGALFRRLCPIFCPLGFFFKSIKWGLV